MRWPALLWLLLLALVPAGPAWPGETGSVQVEAHREGDVVLVKASARMSASLAQAWEVLTGYERYAEFVPDLKSSRVVARSGNVVIVDQKGEAGFFLFHYPVEVRLEVTEIPYARVTSRALSGNFKEMVGVYELSEQSDGLRFVYSGRLVPSFRLPPLLGVAAVRAAVEKQFSALVREIQRRASSQPRSQP